MIIPYKRVTIPHTTPSMLGRSFRTYPLIRISAVGPSDTYVGEGLLDTGSDETVFPDFVAAKIGLDLSNAPTTTLSGVGQVASTLRFAQVNLRIANGGERREWPAWVGFTSTPLKRALLGFGGFLQFFTATFHGDREEVELAVNSLYAGS